MLTTDIDEDPDDLTSGIGLEEPFQDMEVKGTPDYIAPEVMLGIGYDLMVDWWAIGVILYEMKMCAPPYVGDTPDDVFQNVLSQEPVSWRTDHLGEDVEPPSILLKDLIMGLLTHTPSKRLGKKGARELRDHAFFADLDWVNLVGENGWFVPVCDDDEDVSYYDSRLDRYPETPDQPISKTDDCDNETRSRDVSSSRSTASLLVARVNHVGASPTGEDDKDGTTAALTSTTGTTGSDSLPDSSRGRVVVGW